MIKKILVANRGEIAIRVMRSCREMEITSIAIFSEADRTAKHVLYADEAYCVGPAASKESYLNIEKIIEVAKAAHADAIHPGYGFLSENATFARRCQEEGIIFIGPNPETMEAMGDKIAARIKMIEAGVPVVPGTQDNLKSVEEAIELCNKIGFAVCIKSLSNVGTYACSGTQKLMDQGTFALCGSQLFTRLDDNQRKRFRFGDQRAVIHGDPPFRPMITHAHENVKNTVLGKKEE